MNFYNALWIYRNSLLMALPAKNVLLTHEIIEQMEAGKDILQKGLGELETIIDKDSVAIEEAFNKLCQAENDLYGDNKEELLSDNVKKLYDFAVEEEISVIEGEDYWWDFAEEIRLKIEELKGMLKHQNIEINKECFQRIIETSGDKIFSIVEKENGNLSILTYDAISNEERTGCAEYIAESSNYKEYEEHFKEKVKACMVFNRWIETAENYFEKMFLIYAIHYDGKPEFEEIRGYLGHFIKIFPASYAKLLSEEVFKDIDINPSELKILIDYDFVSTLPFFKMVNRYREILMGNRNTYKVKKVSFLTTFCVLLPSISSK